MRARREVDLNLTTTTESRTDEMIAGAAMLRKEYEIQAGLQRAPYFEMHAQEFSLIVVDTGGWYKLCCPTSQLQKPDVLGAIYRVKRQDAPKVEDPWGRMLIAKVGDPGTEPALRAIVKMLGDSRPAVRKQARAVSRLTAGSWSSSFRFHS